MTCRECKLQLKANPEKKCRFSGRTDSPPPRRRGGREGGNCTRVMARKHARSNVQIGFMLHTHIVQSVQAVIASIPTNIII
jgi:hypothetical protein